jgi:two-component system sensor histidine kinase VicK
LRQLVGPLRNLRVVVNERRLAQVQANLLSSAAKFSPSGAVVYILVHEPASRVSGIDDVKTRIFSKLALADTSNSRQKGGVGLGLAILKELLERMHGRIGFASPFWFELPIHSASTRRTNL